MSSTSWRLIVDTQPACGSWNMAVDEAIFELMDADKTLPTLRLYAWNPPCISLGYTQAIADVDEGTLHEHGWDLVRRPTGGRAILHTDEITYSIIGPANDPRLKGGVLESYCRLAQALIKTLALLGLQASAEETNFPPDKRSNPVCFETPSNYEITVMGKKLLGSAQARRRNSVLQHGTLPLTGDLTRITQGLVFKDEVNRQNAAQRLLQHATTVEKLTGKPISWEQAAQAFIRGFEEALKLNLLPGNLTSEELLFAKKLFNDKYQSQQWTSHY